MDPSLLQKNGTVVLSALPPYLSNQGLRRTINYKAVELLGEDSSRRVNRVTGLAGTVFPISVAYICCTTITRVPAHQSPASLSIVRGLAQLIEYTITITYGYYPQGCKANEEARVAS